MGYLNLAFVNSRFSFKQHGPHDPTVRCNVCKSETRFFHVMQFMPEEVLCVDCATVRIKGALRSRRIKFPQDYLGVKSDLEELYRWIRFFMPATTSEALIAPKTALSPEEKAKKLSKALWSHNYFLLANGAAGQFFIRSTPKLCVSCSQLDYLWSTVLDTSRGECDACFTKRLLALNKESLDVVRVLKSAIPDFVKKEYDKAGIPMPLGIVNRLLEGLPDKYMDPKKAAERALGRGWFMHSKGHSDAKKKSIRQR